MATRSDRAQARAMKKMRSDVLDMLAQTEAVTVKNVVATVPGVTQQAIQELMVELIDEGRIEKTGRGAAAKFALVVSSEPAENGEVVTTTPDELAVKVLNERQARALTERIKAAAEKLWQLLAEAHQRKAWKALGYKNWEAYVHEEFDMSRSRSYQLLDQARVIREITAAAELPTPVDISEAAIRDVKDRSPEVVKRVRERVADVPTEQRPSVVKRVIAEARAEEPDKPKRGKAEPVVETVVTGEWTPTSIALGIGAIKEAAGHFRKALADGEWTVELAFEADHVVGDLTGLMPDIRQAADKTEA